MCWKNGGCIAKTGRNNFANYMSNVKIRNMTNGSRTKSKNSTGLLMKIHREDRKSYLYIDLWTSSTGEIARRETGGQEEFHFTPLKQSVLEAIFYFIKIDL